MTVCIVWAKTVGKSSPRLHELCLNCNMPGCKWCKELAKRKEIYLNGTGDCIGKLNVKPDGCNGKLNVKPDGKMIVDFVKRWQIRFFYSTRGSVHCLRFHACFACTQKHRNKYQHSYHYKDMTSYFLVITTPISGIHRWTIIGI